MKDDNIIKSVCSRIAIEPAQDAGTSEGAKKGWQSRKGIANSTLAHAYALASGKRKTIAGVSQGMRMLKNHGHTIESAKKLLDSGDVEGIRKAEETARRNGRKSIQAFYNAHGFV